MLLGSLVRLGSSLKIEVARIVCIELHDVFAQFNNFFYFSLLIYRKRKGNRIFFWLKKIENMTHLKKIFILFDNKANIGAGFKPLRYL